MQVLLLSATLNRHKRNSSDDIVSGCKDSVGGRNIKRTRHSVM